MKQLLLSRKRYHAIMNRRLDENDVKMKSGLSSGNMTFARLIL